MGELESKATGMSSSGAGVGLLHLREPGRDREARLHEVPGSRVVGATHVATFGPRVASMAVNQDEMEIKREMEMTDLGGIKPAR